MRPFEEDEDFSTSTVARAVLAAVGISGFIILARAFLKYAGL